MRYRFTDTEIKKALKNFTLIVDTREQANKHIIAWLDSKKKLYKVAKVDYGDYTCMLPKGSLKGIDRDIWFDKLIVIERKASIDELCGNFSSKDAPRIKAEFAQIKANNTKVRLFIEDNLFHKHLRNGKFRSKYDPKTLFARLKGFEAEYNVTIEAIPPEYMGSEIYNTLYYGVRDYLKRNFIIEGENE